MNLISKKLLEQRIGQFSFPTGTKKETIEKVISGWQKSLTESDLAKTKEKSVQGMFLDKFFNVVLGYGSSSEGLEEWNYIQHPKTEVDAQEADGSLGYFTPEKKLTKAAIELKDAQTPIDKKQSGREKGYTPVEQAYLYATKFDGCDWIIVSNFIEIRLYHKSRTQDFYESFNVLELGNLDEFKRFYFLLCKDNLITKQGKSVIDDLFVKTEQAEDEISVKFYSQFKEARLYLLEHLSQENPKIDKSVLLEKTQKILDRIVFILFCEDTSYLLPNNIFRNTVERALSSFSTNDQRVWAELKGLFRAVDEGNSRVAPPINAYNGGLFKADEMLDSLIIQDETWQPLIKLAAYDFETELNVNILGHIFEQSISDLEGIKRELLEQGTVDATKRKQEGIYYTPSYITRYIIENTIGDYLDEHPNKLSDITILDPACGSGAFLNQAHSYLLERYTTEHQEKIKDKKVLSLLEDQNPVTTNRSILLNSLYGVDLNQESVEITKLSLWLKTARSDEPLENLDKNIKNGNSVISDLEYAGDKAFNWHKEYKQILDNGGFDVIIGNPPYIKEYTNRQAFDGLHSSPYYQGKMDIWTMFACQAIDMLCDGGYFSFIAPNNWITNAGASIFRNKILTDGELINFIDFGNHMVFKDASIQTMIVVFKKCKPRLEYSVKYLKVKDKNIDKAVLNSHLQGEGISISAQITAYEAHIVPADLMNKNISFNNSDIQVLCDKINGTKTYLTPKEIAQGIVAPQEYVKLSHLETIKEAKEGSGIFVISNKEKKQLNLSENELFYVKPFYRSENLDRFYANPSNKDWIIYTKSDIDDHIKELPSIKSHLDTYQKIITSSNKPYGLHRARVESFFTGDKIMSLRKCTEPTFTYTEFDCYVSQSYFVIKTARFNLKYLTVILNSNAIKFWLRNKGKLQGDLFQVDKEPLLNIPLVEADKSIQEQLADLHDKIVEVTKKYRTEKVHCSNFLQTEYKLSKSKALDNVEQLDWDKLSEILKKQKQTLSIQQKEELMDWLENKQSGLNKLHQEYQQLINLADKHVYSLYQLSRDDIALIETII